MEKVIVIGCPGSGKSYFSKELHRITGLNLVHLDMLNWKKDRTVVDRNIFIDRLDKSMDMDSWIIDGNYGSTIERRLKKCDTVFFLDYPLETCLLGVEERYGKKRSDLPWIEEEVDESFLDFIRSYESESRPDVVELLKKYKDLDILVLKSREEAGDYLKGLEKLYKTK